MVSFSNKIFLVAVMGIALLASAVQVEAIEQPACIARGNKCVGQSKPCCKGTVCMSYANRCVGV
ncbi:unnamed protein product [Mortierella alpina]